MHFAQLVRMMPVVLQHVVEQGQRLVRLAVGMRVFMGMGVFVGMRVRGVVGMRRFVRMAVLVAMMIVRTRSPRFSPDWTQNTRFCIQAIIPSIAWFRNCKKRQNAGRIQKIVMQVRELQDMLRKRAKTSQTSQRNLTKTADSCMIKQ